MVVGTATNTTVKGARPTKRLFVHNLEKCSSEDIKQLMKAKGVTPRDVFCTSKENKLFVLQGYSGGRRYGKMSQAQLLA
jgi:hypothetical protein